MTDWATATCPCYSGNEYACTIHGPLGQTNQPMDQKEYEDVQARFSAELLKASLDGKNKRAEGQKPPWYNDTHEAKIFSHFMRWKRGELVDPDSGTHPLVHAAWRCLAIACIETGNVPNSIDPWHQIRPGDYVRINTDDGYDSMVLRVHSIVKNDPNLPVKVYKPGQAGFLYFKLTEVELVG